MNYRTVRLISSYLWRKRNKPPSPVDDRTMINNLTFSDGAAVTTSSDAGDQQGLHDVNDEEVEPLMRTRTRHYFTKNNLKSRLQICPQSLIVHSGLAGCLTLNLYNVVAQNHTCQNHVHILSFLSHDKELFLWIKVGRLKIESSLGPCVKIVTRRQFGRSRSYLLLDHLMKRVAKIHWNSWTNNGEFAW